MGVGGRDPDPRDGVGGDADQSVWPADRVTNRSALPGPGRRRSPRMDGGGNMDDPDERHFAALRRAAAVGVPAVWGSGSSARSVSGRGVVLIGSAGPVGRHRLVWPAGELASPLGSAVAGRGGCATAIVRSTTRTGQHDVPVTASAVGSVAGGVPDPTSGGTRWLSSHRPPTGLC